MWDMVILDFACFEGFCVVLGLFGAHFVICVFPEDFAVVKEDVGLAELPPLVKPHARLDVSFAQATSPLIGSSLYEYRKSNGFG